MALSTSCLGNSRQQKLPNVHLIHYACAQHVRTLAPLPRFDKPYLSLSFLFFLYFLLFVLFVFVVCQLVN